MRRIAILSLLLFAAAWLLYSPTLGADFVWDARAKVLMSDFIHDRGNLPDVLTGHVLTRDVIDNNRPGNLLSLMVDSMLWGKNPAGYHATSVTLHALVCVMLFLLLTRLLENPEPINQSRRKKGRPAVPENQKIAAAFAGALLFAVHPLNCEPVSEVSYREDLLVAFGIMASLLAATEFLKKPGTVRNLALGAGCCIAMLIAISSKENGVAGPVALLAYWWLWRRRSERRAPWLLLIAAAVVVVGGFLAARFTLRPKHSLIFTEDPLRLGESFADTLYYQTRILGMYFRNTIFPVHLCADYGPFAIIYFPFWACLPGLILIIATQAVLALRGRLFAFGSILFWSALLPVCNLVPIYRPVADRFLYVPLTGGAMMAAEGLLRLRDAKPAFREAVYIVVALAACGFAFLSFQREAVWHDNLSLWSETAKQNPFSYDSEDNLGWALYQAERPQEAITPFRRAISLTKSSVADPYRGLALALDALQDTAGANDAFQRAAGIDPRSRNPVELLRALVIEPELVPKLELLARRNAPR